MNSELLLADLKNRGAVVRYAKSGKLHTLDLSSVRPSISDQEMPQLGQLVDLRRLELAGSNVSDSGVRSLAVLQKLRHLDLQGAAVSDASLDVFRGFEHLQFLILTGTAVSKAGLDELRKSMIGTRIVCL